MDAGEQRFHPARAFRNGGGYRRSRKSDEKSLQRDHEVCWWMGRADRNAMRLVLNHLAENRRRSGSRLNCPVRRCRRRDHGKRLARFYERMTTIASGDARAARLNGTLCSVTATPLTAGAAIRAACATAGSVSLPSQAASAKRRVAERLHASIGAEAPSHGRLAPQACHGHGEGHRPRETCPNERVGQGAVH